MPLMLAFNGIDHEKFEVNLVVEQAETNNVNNTDTATTEESKGTLESVHAGSDAAKADIKPDNKA
jgi:hypothetical protein